MQKSYVSQFTVALGPLFSVQTEVVPVKRTAEDSGSLTNVCPICHTHTSQQYVCDAGHGPYKVSDLQKAKSTPQGLVLLSDQDLEALKDDMPVGLLSLHVCPRAEITEATLTEGTSYRLRPAKKAPPGQYALLVAMAGHPELALYGMAKLNTRARATPVLLRVLRRQIVMSQLVPPQEVAESDELGDLEIPDAYREMCNQLLDLWKAPLDKATFTDVKSAKMAELVNSRKEDAVPAQTPDVEDLMQTLRAALEDKKPTTKTRGRRAAA